MSDPSPPASNPEPVRTDLEVFLLRKRVAELESCIRQHGLEPPPAEPASSVPLPPPPPIAVPEKTAPAARDSLRAAGNAGDAAADGAIDPPAAPTSATERFIGTKIAAAVGGIAVLGALGLFIKYAVDNEWLGRLGPEARFAGGLALAALFILAGEIARRRWTREASIGLSGAGVAALFVSVAGGIFVLELFDPIMGSVLAIAATIIGAVVAAHSRSLVVALLCVIGGYALPASAGVMEQPGLAGGLFLTAILALSLVLVAVGPPLFSWLRMVALVAAGPLGAYWAYWSHEVDTVIAVGVVVWWSMLAASCLVEALRGRSPRLNAIALIVASLMASVASFAALAGPAGWTEPLAYLPLGIALGLAAIALQFRDVAELDVASGAAALPDESDGDSRATIEALSWLARAAVAVAPVSLMNALGVLLPAGAFAVSAAGCACILIRARGLLGGAALVAPGALVCMVLAAGASGLTLVRLGGAFDWRWPGFGSAWGSALDELYTIRLSYRQLGALGAIVLLLVPLVRPTPRDVLAHAAAGTATLILAGLLFSTSGPWAAGCAVAALALVLCAFGRSASAGLPYALALVSIALAAWCGTLAYTGWEFHGRDVPLWAQTCALLLPCSALWGLRRLATEHWKPRFDAAASLIAVLGLNASIYINGTFAHIDVEGSFGVLMVALSAGTAGLALLARARSSSAVAAVALVPVVPALAAILAGSLLVVFGRQLPSGMGNSPVWALASIAPLAAALFAVRSVHSLLPRVRFLASISAHSPAAPALLLGGAWCTAVVAMANISGDTPAPHLIIASIALAGAAGLYIGFRKGRSSFRWLGLAMFAMLALRLFVVDLRETSTIFRVAVLFVTGLVLVGTSIAYTLILKPRRGT